MAAPILVHVLPRGWAHPAPQEEGPLPRGRGSETEQEHEADRFAQERLIPSSEYAKVRGRAVAGLTAAAAVQAFAAEVGVSPGIVVGRLQHDKLLRFDRLNDPKTRLELQRVS